MSQAITSAAPDGHSITGSPRRSSPRPRSGNSDPSWEPFPSFGAFLGLPGSLRPPLVKELRAPLEGRANRRAAVPPPPARGRAVLLIPGFMAGDRSLRPLGQWLASGGWTVHPSGLTNSACGEVTAAAMSRRLREVAQLHGGPVTVLGHSRGGQLAQVLAVRHPGMVEQVITLASPLADPFAIHLGVRLLASACSLLTRAGLPGFVDHCPFGGCCQRFHNDLLASSPVPLTCLWSRTDGIVDWRACRRTDAADIEVQASHLGITDNPDSWRALGTILDGLPPVL